MCGLVRVPGEWAQIRIELKLDQPPLNLQQRWNVPPTEAVLAVRSVAGQRHAGLMRWGMIPHWAKDLRVGNTFNARAESVTTKPTFRAAWREGRRCLMVIDGFYEWRESDRQPYSVAMTDGRLMATAGLWQDWTSPDGDVIETVTMITTAANATMATFHHRMPVILTADQWPAWLGETPADEAALLAMLAPCAPDLIRARQVSTRVGNVRNDDAGLVAPVAEVVERLI